MAKERIKPIIIKDSVTDEDKYILEFSKESIRWAENRGFVISELSNRLVGGTEDLIYYAFRMRHPGMSKQQVNDIIDEIGVPDGMIERLIALYNQGVEQLTDLKENPKFSIQM